MSKQTHSELGESTTSSYSVREDGTTNVISAAVPSEGTDNCWVVVTGDARRAFTSNAFGGGTVSSYDVAENGALTLRHASATAVPGKAAEDDNLTDGTTDLVPTGPGRDEVLSTVNGAVSTHPAAAPRSPTTSARPTPKPCRRSRRRCGSPSRSPVTPEPWPPGT